MREPRTVRLDTQQASLVFGTTPDGGVTWLHLGALASDAPGFSMRSRATFSLDRDIAFPVMPTAGSGWFGPSIVELRRIDQQTLPLAFGRPQISDQPERLEFAFSDHAAGIVCSIIFERVGGGAIRSCTTLENRGHGPVCVDRLASAVIPLPANSASLLSWRGVHGAELQECHEAMPCHIWARETRRGIGGHGGPPGVYVLSHAATWSEGLVIACQLAWSGDSRLAIERTDEGAWILSAEAVLQPGELILKPGARYQPPAIILAMSTDGRNGAMAQHHAAVRERVSWPSAQMAPRPVHLNSWEACYFAQDEDKIAALAEAAAAVGVERFVLDDGWFANRSDDRRALGDWTPDPHKYPSGLRSLAQRVRGLGMQFGLWVEPEMVSPNSELYSSHPDWVLSVQELDAPTARNQLVLDMRRPEVRDHLFTVLHRLLSDAPISYLKWDHNRDLAPPGGAAQVAGTYELLARLRTAHPNVEIESCAGGGGRCDAGIAQFVHRFWASDNLDAVSRVAIQRGFAAFLPAEMMGAHIGARLAHATGRTQSLAFRAAVACMGHLGIELHPGELSAHEQAELSGWIDFYKRWRPVLHGGHLQLGAGADGLRWQAHGDGRQWLLFVIRTAPPQDRRPQPINLPFIANRDWNVTLMRLAGENRWVGTQPWDVGEDKSITMAGGWLATSGLPLPPMAGESVAIFHMDPAP